MVTNTTLTISCADIVNEWFRERIAAGAIARNTEAYNQASQALPVLIKRLDDAAAPAPGSALAASASAPETASAATPTAKKSPVDG